MFDKKTDTHEDM